MERFDAPGQPARMQRVRTALGAVCREPVVWILVVAGIFDGISGNPIHSILLFSAAAWPSQWTRWPRGRSPRPCCPGVSPGIERLPLWGVAAALAYAALVGGYPRYSWQATVAVAVPGSIALALAWRGPLMSRPDPGSFDPAGAGAWLGVLVALGLWELTQLLLQPSLTTDSYAHPTLSVLSDPALATQAGRSVGLFVWLGLGWALLLR